MQSLMGETPKTALHRLIKTFPISLSPYLPISLSPYLPISLSPHLPISLSPHTSFNYGYST
ncbi:hypothetical protein [Moorena sp. SIO3H5]|uniref:hypothetical protein n=1 Tax=Moorena sp. SIO3H5 TaxID=2607834 RepID=UPI0013BCCF3C|nr:hypothetical protein [Moorena sp. SIO3H5]NEO69516.1 hypothetical protein [Moorena sp. SIO3H5]